jgi:excinuclease ABC subunit B
MSAAINETNRRRAKQLEYNAAHGITPETIRKNIDDVLGEALAREFISVPKDGFVAEEPLLYLTDGEFGREIKKLETQMQRHASRMEFEKAAELRDRIIKAKKERLVAPLSSSDVQEAQIGE